MTNKRKPKKKLMAPGLCKLHGGKGGVGISFFLYGSIKQAKKGMGPDFVSWPAIPNKKGFYEVEE